MRETSSLRTSWLVVVVQVEHPITVPGKHRTPSLRHNSRSSGHVTRPLPAFTMASSTTASETEMKAAKLPLGWRDQCSACVATLSVLKNVTDGICLLARFLRPSSGLLALPFLALLQPTSCHLNTWWPLEQYTTHPTYAEQPAYPAQRMPEEIVLPPLGVRA